MQKNSLFLYCRGYNALAGSPKALKPHVFLENDALSVAALNMFPSTPDAEDSKYEGAHLTPTSREAMLEDDVFFTYHETSISHTHRQNAKSEYSEIPLNRKEVTRGGLRSEKLNPKCSKCRNTVHLTPLENSFFNTSVTEDKKTSVSELSETPLNSSEAVRGSSSNEKRRPKCAKCRNHGFAINLAGHKGRCPFERCGCGGCVLVDERRRLNSHAMELKTRKKNTAVVRPTPLKGKFLVYIIHLRIRVLRNWTAVYISMERISF